MPQTHLSRNTAGNFVRNIRSGGKGALGELLRANGGVKLEQAKKAARQRRVPLVMVLEEMAHLATLGIKEPTNAINASIAAQHVSNRVHSQRSRKQRQEGRKAAAYVAYSRPPIVRMNIGQKEVWDKIFERLSEVKIQNTGSTTKNPFGRASPEEKTRLRLEMFKMWLEGYTEKEIAKAFGFNSHNQVHKKIQYLLNAIRRNPKLRELVKQLGEQ